MLEFIMQDWLWGFVSFFAFIITWVIQTKKDRDTKKDEIKTLKERNYLDTKVEYRAAFAQLAKLPGNNRDIFKQGITEFQGMEESHDEVRHAVFTIIDILADVHYSINNSNEDILQSPWYSHFQYVFHPKRALFCTAFEKFSLEKHRLRPEFIGFVQSLIKKHPVQNLPEPKERKSA